MMSGVTRRMSTSVKAMRHVGLTLMERGIEGASRHNCAPGSVKSVLESMG